MFELQELIEQLSSFEITVREQARTSENMTVLQYPRFFRDNPVDSVKLADITIQDVRFISDRREWNADGRYIPAKTPKARMFEMVPLESYFVIGEREMQDLGERFNGNRQLIIDSAKASIPRRVESLTNSIIWSIEYESLLSWATGKIIVTNPQTGKVYEASMQIGSDHYVTDATPWSDSNAFDRILNYAREAVDLIGPVQGVLVRQDLALLIQKSAPRMIAGDVRMTLRNVNDYLSDELGTGFTIETFENTVEKFDGAGVDTSKVKLWPSGKVAFIPQGSRIGEINMAPQFRAHDIPQVVSEFEGFDQRGIRVYYEKMNSGKALKVQAQANWLGIPDENQVFVVNVTKA